MAGVSPEASLNAVRNTSKVRAGKGDTKKLTGENGTTVVTNAEGKIITASGNPDHSDPMQTATSSVALSTAELELLIESIPDEGIRMTLREAREEHLRGGRVGRLVSVDLEGREIATLLCELLDVLCEIGLGPDDEPNRTGHAIEELIDKLNRVQKPLK